MNDTEFKTKVTDSLARIETAVARDGQDIAALEKEQIAQGKDVAALKVKSTIAGGIGGAITGFGSSLLRSVLG